MKIGIVSDTHSRALPKQLLDALKKVDLIIHAGDFCDLTVVEKLRKIKTMKAVYGNMDGPEIRKVFPRQEIVKCGKYKIGIFHGEGAPQHLLETVKNEFKGQKVDVVIFGHSHHPMNEKIGNVLFFNPGSPNDDMFAPYCSYGMIEITDNGIEGKIIKVETHG